MFFEGFEKTAKAIGNIGKHLHKHRKDYLMGVAATGSLGTAYGANKSHKKTAGLPAGLHKDAWLKSATKGASRRGLKATKTGKEIAAIGG